MTDANLPEFKIRVFGVAGSRQYELPCRDSIGAIIFKGGSDTANEYDIIIEQWSGEPQRINKLYPCYMSLLFPLLFIFGEEGYHPGLRLVDVTGTSSDEEKKMSMKMYYAYQLHDHFQEYSLLTRAGRLFQQYVVTAYCSIEQYRLDFIREHQNDIRNEYLSRLYDASLRGDRDGSDVGSRTILPSSFTGGTCYMYSHYLDALAICRVHGNSSFFITFTCNVKWPEIEEFMERFPYVTVADRPDAVDRVFEQKIYHLISYLRDQRPFGLVEAASRVHAHEDIDRYVSAELPNREVDLEGYRVVSKLMMHGPCGLANRSVACMKNIDTCTKGFPKPYCDCTSIDSQGFLHYQRRHTGSTTVRQNVELDNAYVVPYNLSLCMLFYAHINVEYCEWTMLIKYLFKYISKGTDRIVAQVTRPIGEESTSSSRPVIRVDEIKNFQDARYVGPHEACWCILGFDIHFREPAVQILAVHLKNMQRVFIRGRERIQTVVDNPTNKRTTLTEWLRFNNQSALRHHLTYLEFPSEFVWHTTDKYWSPRRYKSKPSIGRLAYIHPSAGDLFYQRMLLCHQKGCKSFRDIRTVNGQVYPTNRAACQALGLLGDDREWAIALQEAQFSATAAKMRSLFCQILLFCDVTNPVSLWRTHWETIKEDIPRRLSQLLHIPEMHLSESDLQAGILYELKAAFSFYGRSVRDFGMDLPPRRLLEILRNRIVMEERSYDCEVLARERDLLVLQLNVDQRAIYDMVVDAVINNRQRLIFVYGHGGNGKTYVWKSIIYALRCEGRVVLAVASSGIASLLLRSGRTSHSRFKIPLDLSNESMCTVKKKTQLADLLTQTDLIIWDEAPMNDRRCFEILDRTLRDILDTPNHLFGKKTVLLGGDFRQTLPVKKGEGKQEIIGSSVLGIKYSEVRVLEITLSQRYC